MRGKEDHSRERNLRSGQTEAEALLWRHLRDRRLGKFKFRRQHRIGPYVVDFACTESKLIVEVDGGQHGDRITQDAARTLTLEASGYRLIRFWNDEVLTRTEDVLIELLRALTNGQLRSN